MAQDALEQLLRAADASAPAPPLMPELPALVRRRRQVRRRRAATVLAAAALLLPLLVTIIFVRPSPAPQVVIERDVPSATHELAELQLRAALHEQTAAHLLAARPTTPAPAAADDHSVLINLRQQRDRAALILIYEADQAARQKQTDRALAAYRRTIELFPTTYWAGVARQRLKEMPT